MAPVRFKSIHVCEAAENGETPKHCDCCKKYHRENQKLKAKLVKYDSLRGALSWRDPERKQQAKDSDRHMSTVAKAYGLTNWSVDEQRLAEAGVTKIDRRGWSALGDSARLSYKRDSGEARAFRRNSLSVHSPSKMLVFTSKLSPRSLHVLHPSSKKPGSWQVTHFRDGEPYGDFEAASRQEAVHKMTDGSTSGYGGPEWKAEPYDPSKHKMGESVVESAPNALPFLRRGDRVAYYEAMLRELANPLTEEAQARTYNTPVSLPRSFGEPKDNQSSLNTYTAVMSHRDCRMGSSKGVKRHSDMRVSFKNNATSAKIGHLCAADDISVQEFVHKKHDDPEVMKKHTHHLYREIHGFVKAHVARHGAKHIHVTTSNPHAHAFLAKHGDVVRSLDRSKTYRIHTDSFHVPGAKRKLVVRQTPTAVDPRGHAPLTCNNCGVEKTRNDFKNKNANKRLRVDHPAYGKKQSCKSCDNESNKKSAREFRTAAIQWRGNECASCGEKDHAKLDLDHVDERTKSFNIARPHSRKPEVMHPEVKKTVPLCHTCHTAKKSGDMKVRAKAQARLTSLNAADAPFPVAAKARGGNQRKLRAVAEGRKSNDIEDMVNPDDVIEPFNGLAVRAGEDSPTILRFDPKRKFLFTKPKGKK